MLGLGWLLALHSSPAGTWIKEQTMSDNDFDDDDDFCVAMDNEGRIEGTCDHLETGSRVVQLSTGVKCCLTPSRLSTLRTDASLADCGMVKDTFWLKRDTPPRCALEQLALAVFEHHTANVPEAAFGEVSGAEWWVQCKDPTSTNATTRQVPFHWDKDEQLHTAHGFSVCPQISTVTYLSGAAPTDTAVTSSQSGKQEGWAAPTVVLARRMGFEGDVSEAPILEGAMCFPAEGRHLSFDGRFLHGAPRELGLPNPSIHKAGTDEDHESAAPPMRVTFLVNVWLQHKPYGIQPFPAAMVPNMTPLWHDFDAKHLFGASPVAASSSGGPHPSIGLLPMPTFPSQPIQSPLESPKGSGPENIGASASREGNAERCNGSGGSAIDGVRSSSSGDVDSSSSSSSNRGRSSTAGGSGEAWRLTFPLGRRGRRDALRLVWPSLTGDKTSLPFPGDGNSNKPSSANRSGSSNGVISGHSSSSSSSSSGSTSVSSKEKSTPALSFVEAAWVGAVKLRLDARRPGASSDYDAAPHSAAYGVSGACAWVEELRSDEDSGDDEDGGFQDNGGTGESKDVGEGGNAKQEHKRRRVE